MNKKLFLIINISVFILFAVSFIYSQTSYLDTINAEEIIKKINAGGDISYKNTIIKGELDFTTVNPNNIVLDTNSSGLWGLEGNMDYKSNGVTLYITNNISFVNCKFQNKVITFGGKTDDNGYSKTEQRLVFNNNVEFIACEFEDDVNFYETNFMEYTNFYKSTFHKKAKFTGVKFRSTTLFGSTFKNDAEFNEVLFTDNVSYNNSVFEGESDFSYSYFASTTNFTKSIFKDQVSFNWSNFSQELYLFDVIFKKYVSFSNAYFEKGQPKLSLTTFESGFTLE